MVSSTDSTLTRLANLESRIENSETRNTELKKKISELEEKASAKAKYQCVVNEKTDKKITDLQIEQGYTHRSVLDLGSELKERKMIITGIHESKGEDTHFTALECINEVIEAAIATTPPEEDTGDLNLLRMDSIDHVFRIGKEPRGSYKRNVSVTFKSMDDKEMVLRARAATKENPEIRYSMFDDQTQDGRTHKAQIKRISTVARAQGRESKIAGNKLIIDNKTYYAN